MDNRFKHWSDEELRFLIEFYPERGAARCAKHLGRSKGSVYQKAREINVKRAFVDTHKSGQLESAFIAILRENERLRTEIAARQTPKRSLLSRVFGWGL